MGFDLYGVDARSKKGEYFRNNIWWWRALAEYVLEHVSFEDNDGSGWSTNSGYVVSAHSALKIAHGLDALLTSGAVSEYSRRRRARLKALPDDPCLLCKGSGQRNDEIVVGKCNGCDGKGSARPWATWYPFSVENVRSFARFCRESGGFEIR